MAIAEGTGFDRRGTVDYDGVRQEVALAYLPEAQVGDYVIVHVGFAISQVDEAEAQEVFKFLAEMEELAELEIPQPADLVTVHANGQQP